MPYASPYLPPAGVVYKTVPQAAEIFQTEVSTIYRWIKGGILKSKKIGGRRYVLFADTPTEQVEQSDNYEELARRVEGA